MLTILLLISNNREEYSLLNLFIIVFHLLLNKFGHLVHSISTSFNTTIRTFNCTRTVSPSKNKNNRMENTSISLEGGCQCRSLRYRLDEKQMGDFFHCHCSICRKMHGAFFASFAVMQKSQLKVICPDAILHSFVLFCGIC